MIIIHRYYAIYELIQKSTLSKPVIRYTDKVSSTGLKILKVKMYGRASFQLLRKMVLAKSG